MNLYIFGTTVAELPDLPDDIGQIYLATDDTDTRMLEWAFEQTAGVVLVGSLELDITEDQIEDQIEDVVDTDDPSGYMIGLITATDLAFMAWADTDTRHKELSALTAKGVTVLDMTDGYQRLVLDDRPDMESMIRQITARVTADVLKTVRAEMQDMLRTRRHRPSKG